MTQAMSWMHRRTARLCSTHRVACSEKAGRFMFGNADFSVLPSAVKPEAYAFSVESRRLVRADLGLGETSRLIGTVGRLTAQKNQAYLIRRVAKLRSGGEDVSLLIAGDRPLRDNLEELVVFLDIASHVFLVGSTDNAASYLSALDLFAFPSSFEGFGMAALEAQLNGLPCVVSENGPFSVDVSTGIRHIPLSDEAAWDNVPICANGNDVCLTATVRRYDIHKQRKQLLTLFHEGQLQASVDRSVGTYL